MSLENAPDEVKLAVDLIMLLENHEIPAETVLKALEIVRRDFEGKVTAGGPHPHPSPLPGGRGDR
ncbi:pleiotropic regulatory protein RsmS [Enterobacter hormaechei]